nr:DUF4113 domain-containing protein [Ferrimonas kyonanensis]
MTALWWPFRLRRRPWALKKFVPLWQQTDALPKHQRDALIRRSSTFELFSEMSHRFHDLLNQRYGACATPYSVDESLIKLPSRGDLIGEGRSVRKQIWTELRLGCKFSAAPTITLAKAASELAKSHPDYRGLCILERPDRLLLATISVGDVWGVGRRLAPRLEAAGIRTAWDLAQYDRLSLRRLHGVTLERTHLELNGKECMRVADMDVSNRQQIMSSRSLKEKPVALVTLMPGVMERVSTVAKKLRDHDLVASEYLLQLSSSPFDRSVRWGHSQRLRLAYPTDDIRELATAAAKAVELAYRPGVPIGRVTVGALDPCNRDECQLGLFDAPVRKGADKLMAGIKAIQSKYGTHSLQIAAQKLGDRSADNGARHSPRSLTRWEEIPSVR